MIDNGNRTESEGARAVARAQTYALLARALRYPVKAFFASLRDGSWAEELAAAAMASGLVLRDSFFETLRQLQAEAPEELAQLQHGHTALFAGGSSCPHEESYYTASHAFQKADLLADIAGFYAAFGLRVSRTHRELPDFLGAELEFLHVACLLEARACNEGDADALETCRRAEGKFLSEHLAGWVGSLCERMEQIAAGPFYVRLARLIAGFLEAACAQEPAGRGAASAAQPA